MRCDLKCKFEHINPQFCCNLLHASYSATGKKCDCHKKAILSKHPYLNLFFEINTDVHLGGMYVIFLCLSTTN